eukprot:1146217-Pelagomonas_calceolata.AAC.4
MHDSHAAALHADKSVGAAEEERAPLPPTTLGWERVNPRGYGDEERQWVPALSLTCGDLHRSLGTLASLQIRKHFLNAHFY